MTVTIGTFIPNATGQRQYRIYCVAEHYIHKLGEFLDLNKHSVL
jgi:hypothetical protein